MTVDQQDELGDNHIDDSVQSNDFSLVNNPTNTITP